jgi:hypothetical protein
MSSSYRLNCPSVLKKWRKFGRWLSSCSCFVCSQVCRSWVCYCWEIQWQVRCLLIWSHSSGADHWSLSNRFFRVQWWKNPTRLGMCCYFIMWTCQILYMPKMIFSLFHLSVSFISWISCYGANWFGCSRCLTYYVYFTENTVTIVLDQVKTVIH